MTEYDAPRFAQTFAALAIAMRTDVDDPQIELYFRALEDVPIDLLEAASIELARESTFFPKPAEWRAAVDRILDRKDRLALPAGDQLQLPGDVGADSFRCADCDNTGWVDADRECDKNPCRPKDSPPDTPHAHRAVRRCENTYCVERRRKLAERKRRYSKQED